jgi:hypothetical protein
MLPTIILLVYIRRNRTKLASGRKIAFMTITICPTDSGLSKFGLTPAGGGKDPTILSLATISRGGCTPPRRSIIQPVDSEKRKPDRILFLL